MGKIFFTSDLHFCHDRAFLYEPRGFKAVLEMNQAIVTNWNSVVSMDDDVYVLGDLMLNDNEEGMRLIKSLKGRIHVILGNHDTNTRVALYESCCNIVEVTYASMVHYNGYHFFLTHFPCITSNLEKESLKSCTIGLFGHTHQKTNFYQDIPYIYHVGLDSHRCTPVCIDEVIADCEIEVSKCLKQL